MSGQDDAIEDVLAGFVPIGEDHPRVQAFEDAVVEHIAQRPSPEQAETQADRIERKLDEILTLLRGGTP